MADEWYYTNQGRQMGPVPQVQLQQLAASQQLLPTDFVWKPGLAQWLPASSVQGLFAAPAGAYQSAAPDPAPAASSYAPAPQRQQQVVTPQEPARSGFDEDRYDDPPRRRPRRRKKKRAKGKAPIGLIIGLISGVVGVVLVITIVGIVLVARGGFPTSGGTDFIKFSPDPKFRCLMPKSPKYQSKNIGKIHIRMWVHKKSSREFVVAVTRIGFFPANQVQRRLDGARKGAVSNVGGKLISERNITLAGKYPGREIDVELPRGNGYVRARFWIVGTQVYQLVVVGESRSYINSTDCGKFLNSLEILAE